jgi:hypothetical protein
LIVNSLTRDITPTTDIPGITFRRRSNITLNSNTDPFQIIQSQEAAGIDVQSISSDAVIVNSSGNIQTTGTRSPGISAVSAPEFFIPSGSRGGPVSVTASGTISTAGASAPGIFASSGRGDFFPECGSEDPSALI